MKSLSLVLATVLLLGCPPDDGKPRKAPVPSPSCTSVGQSCEFSPGKLGTCVSKDPCTGDGCLVCQSQH